MIDLGWSKIMKGGQYWEILIQLFICKRAYLQLVL